MFISIDLILSVALEVIMMRRIHSDIFKIAQADLTAEILRCYRRALKQAFLIYRLFRHDDR
jgi:hypothetical protein